MIVLLLNILMHKLTLELRFLLKMHFLDMLLKLLWMMQKLAVVDRLMRLSFLLVITDGEGIIQ